MRQPRSTTGASLLVWCAYYGDVSAMRHLLSHGERLETLGENFDLNGAAYHGRWRLCEFLIEQGADVNRSLADTGETPLHAALSKTNRWKYTPVVKLLLAHGADANRATVAGRETGSFMRDCRTKGKTPLHRAAAFGYEEDIESLIAAGAKVDALDVNGDSPLSWASWHGRPRRRAGHVGTDSGRQTGHDRRRQGLRHQRLRGGVQELRRSGNGLKNVLAC
jgi:uncharacterized protein